MTMRHKLFATWKNQVSLQQSLLLAAVAVDASAAIAGLFELSVCPSMTALAPVAAVTSVTEGAANTVALTAQNMGWDGPRSLTGETSAADLTNLGCRYVIVGHSERRRFLGETDDMIARKLQTAFTHGLTPILCVGDTREDHQAGRSDAVVQAQLNVLLGVYPASGAPFLVAYEPTWAISTSRDAHDCNPDEAGARHSLLRSVIAGELGAQLAADTTLLYGGSVTAADAESYLTQTDIDGGLVGAASQDRASFHALIDATISTYRRSTPAAAPLSSADAGQPRPR